MHLHLLDYRSPDQWRWRLDDAAGRFLADHEVRLDVHAAEFRGLTDLPGYLNHYGGARGEIRPHRALLEELGAWLGEQVFGGLGDALLDHHIPPATPIHVHLPHAALHLVQAPIELAHLDGESLAGRGIRFIYQLEAAGHKPNKPGDGPLRILAVFSLPEDETPLNLRRERYQLKRLLVGLASTRGLDLELRIVQYGATRETLKDALRDGRGWDLIHFSGHGNKGLLALEDAAGRTDCIETDDLKTLLRLAKRRLKLLTLSACHSGANLDRHTPFAPPARDSKAQVENTVYPSLAQELADELDCAVLAMRYAVGDQFATDLGLALYRGLLQDRQPLPGALQLALAHALEQPAPLLSIATPILFGPTAATLTLAPQKGDSGLRLDSAGPGAAFPPEPERFVGRLRLLLQAGGALAPEGQSLGVLFHGMAGAGKTACALELAWRHERDRFTHWAWYKAPDQDNDIADALRDCLVSLEHQLEIPPGTLVAHLHDPEQFKHRTLPWLGRLLGENAVCICLDNLEGLLSAGDQWRDPLWGDLLQALLGHRGTSRLILTSRRVPRDLSDHAKLVRLPVHALSLQEATLLLREMAHTRHLFDDSQGHDLLRRLLAVVQGHPKLLELANCLAEDRAALVTRLGDAPETPEVRAFFDTGESRRDEAGFVTQLGDWAEAAYRGLDGQAQRLIQCLARMEEPDRDSRVLEAVWDEVMEDGSGDTGGEAGLEARRARLADALHTLERSGLVELRPVPLDPEDDSDDTEPATRYGLHPAIAERLRGLTDAETLGRLDQGLGEFWTTRFMLAQANETLGQGRALTHAARHAIPYWMRREKWEAAAILLERIIQRDRSPATLAYALPRLERIAEATVGTDEGFNSQGLLATTLYLAGRYGEAEQRLRQGMKQAATAGNYRLASASASHLLNLLRAHGKLKQALALAETRADYSRRAGLGPWSRLAAEGQRLQILNDLGRWKEVLDRVVALPSIERHAGAQRGGGNSPPLERARNPAGHGPRRRALSRRLAPSP